MKRTLEQQAKLFSKMADDVTKKFPNDIQKQAKALGKAFEKVTKRKKNFFDMIK